jgi:hypothetical protein
MVVTVPLGRRSSLIVAWTRAAGLRSAVWRATCGDLPDDDDDDAGTSGVREHRAPRPPRGGGAIALPRDED